MRTQQAVVAGVPCLAVILWLGSCSTGRAPTARMGTPAWFWGAAKEQFAAGDFVKTQEHLEKIMVSESPLKARATTWHLVVLGGMAAGLKDLAEAYEDGSMVAKTGSGEFRRVSNDMYRLSKQYSIGLAQEVDRIRKDMAGVEQFTLEFSFPIGSAAEIGTLARVRQGMMPQESERASAQRQSLARGIVMETSAVVGVGDDSAKAAESFKTPPVQVPRAVFLLGVAETLYEQSKIFDRRKLNEPDKRKILLEQAVECLKPAADTGDAGQKKKAKELLGKIEKEQKTLPKAA